MTSSFILRLLLKILVVGRTVSVIIALQARSHAEVIHEEWVLVDVLKGAELATISETQPEAVSEIVVGCQSIRFLRLFLGLSRPRSHFLALFLREQIGDVRSVEAIQFIHSPVKLAKAQVLDARSMVQLLPKRREHLVSVPANQITTIAGGDRPRTTFIIVG